jgi:hypothetical protein
MRRNPRDAKGAALDSSQESIQCFGVIQGPRPPLPDGSWAGRKSTRPALGPTLLSSTPPPVGPFSALVGLAIRPVTTLFPLTRLSVTGAIHPALHPVLDAISATFHPVLNPIAAAVEPIFNTIPSPVKPILEAVASAIEPLRGTIMA